MTDFLSLCSIFVVYAGLLKYGGAMLERMGSRLSGPNGTRYDPHSMVQLHVNFSTVSAFSPHGCTVFGYRIITSKT